MKRPRGGSLFLVLTPDELLARLATLVPPPRVHGVRYHGVFAPNAKVRARVVPRPLEPPLASRQWSAARAWSLGAQPTPAKLDRPARTYRVPWADLLKKVFAVDVLACPDAAAGCSSSPSSPRPPSRSASSTTSASTPRAAARPRPDIAGAARLRARLRRSRRDLQGPEARPPPAMDEHAPVQSLSPRSAPRTPLFGPLTVTGFHSTSRREEIADPNAVYRPTRDGLQNHGAKVFLRAGPEDERPAAPARSADRASDLGSDKGPSAYRFEGLLRSRLDRKYKGTIMRRVSDAGRRSHHAHGRRGGCPAAAWPAAWPTASSLRPWLCRL